MTRSKAALLICSIMLGSCSEPAPLTKADRVRIDLAMARVAADQKRSDRARDLTLRIESGSRRAIEDGGGPSARLPPTPAGPSDYQR